MSLKFIDLFCGIGGFRVAANQAAKKLNIETECVFSSDIDANAQVTYKANFGENPFGDISNASSDIIPEHDILFVGFPCQPFSIIGKGEGFEDTRGTLFFEIARILDEKKPSVFVLENVKQLVTHQKGHTFKRILEALDELGYFFDYRILNALDYGLPQKRERVFIIGFKNPKLLPLFHWPREQKKRLSLEEILESNVDKKYFASDYIKTKRKEKHSPTEYPSIWHENKSGNVSSHPFSCALRAGASYNYLLVNGERRLTSREMLRLQGFPDNYKIVVPYSQIRKQTGNAVPVNVVEAILTSLFPLLKQKSVSLNGHKVGYQTNGKRAQQKTPQITNR